MVGCAFLQSTRQMTHTRTDSAQKESTCDGGKLLLGLGQHTFEPRAVSLWPCSTTISMPTTELRLSQVRTGILQRAGSTYQPQTASSAASQCCQPCMHPILLFDVAQSQTVSLGEGVVRDSGRQSHKHTTWADKVSASPSLTTNTSWFLDLA